MGAQEARDLRRVVLTVPVERDDRLVVGRDGVTESSPQRACPWFGLCVTTVAPASSALAAVSSVEPSSTTRTGRCADAPRTTAPIRLPSSWAGMTARIMSAAR
jgi:hypothetical protein